MSPEADIETDYTIVESHRGDRQVDLQQIGTENLNLQQQWLLSRNPIIFTSVPSVVRLRMKPDKWIWC